MKPVKLIIFLIILGIIVFFIGFNLTNVSDISFGFHTFADVPIFISLFIAFAAGVVVMLPFCLTKKRKKPKIPSGNAEELDEPENT